MDGQKYLAYFEPLDRSALDSAEVTVDDVEDLYDVSLTSKIQLLYGAGEIALLGTQQDTRVMQEAEDTLSRDRMFDLMTKGIMSSRRAEMRRNGFRLQPDSLHVVLHPDYSGDLPAAVLVENTKRAHRKLTGHLTAYSDNLFSHVLKQVDRSAGKRGGIDAAGTAVEVKRAIAEARQPLHEVLHDWRGIITVDKDYELGPGGSRGRPAGVRVSVDRVGTRHVPDWLGKADTWEDQLHRLCSTYTEVETLIALQEWVIARGLPFVPLIAPIAYEGRQADTDSQHGNPRGDLLLCSVLPGDNQIIPVQTKNRVTREVRQEYHPEVALVSASDIAPHQGSTKPVRAHNGRMTTGHCVTTRYGQLLEHYYINRSHIPHGYQPSKAQKAAFAETLQVPFRHFDAEILPRIRPTERSSQVVQKQM